MIIKLTIVVIISLISLNVTSVESRYIGKNIMRNNIKQIKNYCTRHALYITNSTINCTSYKKNTVINLTDKCIEFNNIRYKCIKNKTDEYIISIITILITWVVMALLCSH